MRIIEGHVGTGPAGSVFGENSFIEKPEVPNEEAPYG